MLKNLTGKKLKKAVDKVCTILQVAIIAIGVVTIGVIIKL